MVRRRINRWLSVFALLLPLASSASLWTAPVLAASPTMTLNPTSGPPGTVVTITGSGFDANDLMRFWFGPNQSPPPWFKETPTFYTDNNGGFVQTWAIPSDDPKIVPGEYFISAYDVDDNEVPASVIFTVTSGTAGTIDLYVESVTGPDTVCAYENPVFQAHIWNKGTQESGGFGIAWNADGTIHRSSNESIPPGSVDTWWKGFTWENLAPGHHTLTFTADDDNRIRESNEANNSYRLTFEAIDCDEPPPPQRQVDLYVSEIRSPSVPICANKNPTFRAIIWNQGSVASGGFNISWRADSTLHRSSNESIPPQSSDEWPFTWEKLSPGKHQLTFTADSDNFIPETNESNNSYTLAFEAVDCSTSTNPPPPSNQTPPPGYNPPLSLPEALKRAPRNTDPNGNYIYFHETGHNLCNGFRWFWEKFGGLAIYGYPVTEEFGKDGVTMQYFERARFEWRYQNRGKDPEHYDVELGLVGNELAVGRQGEAAFRQLSANTQSDSNCQFFPETRHRLCYGFKSFWYKYGGWQVFGLPISEEFKEANPDTGQVYTVQYFQRARFEWHPGEWPEQYDVMLGRIPATVLTRHDGHDAVRSRDGRTATPLRADELPQPAPSPPNTIEVRGTALCWPSNPKGLFGIGQLPTVCSTVTITIGGTEYKPMNYNNIQCSLDTAVSGSKCWLPGFGLGDFVFNLPRNQAGTLLVTFAGGSVGPTFFCKKDINTGSGRFFGVGGRVSGEGFWATHLTFNDWPAWGACAPAG